MKFGKLFSALIKKYPKFANLSSNKFSTLTYRELREIAKSLKADGYFGVNGNYTHDSHRDLANRVHNTVKTSLV